MLYYFLLFFILYLPLQLALNPAPGIDLASSRVLAILIFLFWLASALKRQKIYLARSLNPLLIFSFLFLSLLSILFAENWVWGGRKALFLLSFFPLYFSVSDWAKKEGRADRIISGLVGSAFLASGIALFQFGMQFVIGLDPALKLWQKIIPSFLGSSFSQSVLGYSSWLVNIGGETYFRAVGFFPDPHMLSLFLGLIFPWSVLLAFEKSKSHPQKGFLIGTASIFILLADVLTFSRGGYLGLIGGTLFVSFWILKRQPRKYFLFGGLLLFLGVTFWLFPNPLSERLNASFNRTEGSNQERIRNWQEALQIIQKNPAFGTGLGNYSLAVKPTAGEREPIYAHNLFLDIAAETGIINSLIFLLLLLGAMRSFILRSKHATLYLGGAWGLAIFFFHSLFETGLYSVQVLPVLVVILALSGSPKDEK